MDHTFCPCCRLTLSSSTFAPGMILCSTCASLPVNTLAIKLLFAAAHEKSLSHNGTPGRAASREAARAVRLAHIAASGKRCADCHARKPASEYYACKSRADGLQGVCKRCITVRQSVIASSPPGAGHAAWRAVRDAMRLQSNSHGE